MNNVPSSYYRCTIIRGKSQTEMDDLLPAYAGIISDICPCNHDSFDEKFNNELSAIMFHSEYANLPDEHKKTIRNHITEIAGKLLGLYWCDRNGWVYASASTEKLLSDNDQPAFFKNLCLNFQFPNGSQKIQTVLERINDGIKLKPFHFIITLLSLARGIGLALTKDEIAFYVLGSREVLQGNRTPQEVLKIISDKRNGGGTTEKLPPGSYFNQHIKEQLNLLELANIIRCAGGEIHLNIAESRSIQMFLNEYQTPLKFDMNDYDLSSAEERKKMYAEWGAYYGGVFVKEDALSTPVEALQTQDATDNSNHPTEYSAQDTDTTELGDAGELLIYEMEKKRVRETHPRLENKVLLLGKQRGLGYDISSVEAAENIEEPEFARFIEVKSTKRTTVPSLQDTTWLDTINLTRKEWVAAKQYRSAYNIYRVYYTIASVVVRKMNDPYSKFEKKIIEVVPTTYRMDFSMAAIDKEYATNENA